MLGRIKFRRAVALMLMTLVLPGSAQLVAGRREVGRIAMRIWFGLILTGGFFFLVGLVSHTFVFWVLTNTFVLGLVRIVLILMAVGWAFLFMDAWRIGDPLALRQKQRLAMVGINGVLCFSVAGTLLFASHVVGVQKDFMSAMFANGHVSGATDGEECTSFAECAELLAGGSEIRYAGPSGIGPIDDENDPSSAFVGVYTYNAENKNELTQTVEGVK